jgi:conjugal transfer mating pair stabilization protein TraN
MKALLSRFVVQCSVVHCFGVHCLVVQCLRFALALVMLIVLPLDAANAQVNTCRKTGEVCTQGAATRLINGAQVYRACWAFQDTYECVDPSAVNYCAPLQTNASCGQTSSTCLLRAFNNDCLLFKNTESCSTDPGVPDNPPHLVRLPDTTTIIKDAFNEANCAPLATNPKCVKTGRVCSQGPETRVINGVSEFRDCWEYTDTYNCGSDAYLNYCGALSATPQCKVIADVCGVTAPDGSCASRLKTYDCGVTVSDPNIVLLSESYTITGNSLDPSQCVSLASAPNCQLAQETCLEPGVTKVINGLAVTQACWGYERTFTCAATSLTSDCASLISRGCTKTASNCIANDPSGACNTVEQVYRCQVAPGTTTNVTNCGNQQFCQDGKCFDTSYQPDKDFLKVAAGMEAVREGGVYLDPKNLTLFNGQAENCKQQLGFIGNCCTINSVPRTTGSNQAAAQAGQAGLKVTGELVSTGSAYMYDALFSDPTTTLGAIASGVSSIFSGAEATNNAAQLAGTTGASAEAVSAGTNFSFYGAEFTFSAAEGFSFVAFDPVSFAISIAITIILEMTKCDDGEQLLSLHRGQNLCTYVGEWCAGYTLGKCAVTKQTHCCFNSRLMKIINAEGRKQLGLNNGTAQAPICTGFNEAQIAQLDFSTMDLSEFYAEILAKQPN